VDYSLAYNSIPRRICYICWIETNQNLGGCPVYGRLINMSTRTSQLKEAIPSPPRVWTNVNVIIIYINWGNSQLLHYSYYPIIIIFLRKALRTNFFIKSFLGFFTSSTKRTGYFTVCMSCPALFFILFFSFFLKLCLSFFIKSF